MDSKNMHASNIVRNLFIISVCLLGACLLWSCESSPDTTRAADAIGGPETFESPDQAVDAMVSAIKADDMPGLRRIFGPDGESITDSGDPIDDRNQREGFIALCEERMTIEMKDSDMAVLFVGEIEWPFPVPIVKNEDGWYFDSAEGREELLDRRIGRNELNTIQVCLAVADAQDEYYQRDRNGDGVLEYAPTFRSSPGQQDGLYWPTADGEPLSPLGDLVAAAARDRYFLGEAPPSDTTSAPFHGYYFSIMQAQGPDAPGGAFSYKPARHMIGGWAMVAWPAQYGQSGIKTFIVNHRGVIYEQDLGEQTESQARDMEVFNPGAPWTPVPEAALELD